MVNTNRNITVIILRSYSENYKKIKSDNAISIIENLNKEKKNSVLDKLHQKIGFY